MKKIVSFSIISYIFITYFYGIITKLTIRNSLLFELKTILPEIFLILIIISSFILLIKERKFNKLNKYMFILVIYILFIFIMNLMMKPNFQSVAFVIRDLMLPIMVWFLLQQVDLNGEEIINKIITIFIIFTISGFILSLLQREMGWEWTSKFYTGYSFYGVDSYSKIKVWHGNGILRVPSLTGNSVTFGFYNLIIFLFIWKSNIKNIHKYILISISILNILLSTSKTSLIILIFIILIYMSKKLHNYLKFDLFIVAIILSIAILNILLYFNPNFLFSLYERLKHWQSSFSYISISSILIPLNLFNITAAATGFLSFIDNSYLYFLFSTGIVGIVLIILNVLKMKKKSNDNSYFEILNYMILIFFISSIFVNITQGRAFFSSFCLLSPILLKSHSKNERDEI